MAVYCLIGYMGSGKSTYGRYLANKLSMPFVDLDELLVTKYSMPIKQMFSQFGEKWFRAVESETLMELFDGKDKIVALGGGTPLYNDNMQAINDFSVSIYLQSSVETLFNYLKDNKSERPLIADLSDKELRGFIDQHLTRREEVYKRAKIHVNCDNKDFNEIIRSLETLVI